MSTVNGRASRPAMHPDRYKWIALSNTTLGILMATINQSIVIIALPAIFRGIHLNPLVPGNTSYLLWIMLGFLVVMAVLVVSLGRVGDMFGRVRMYNLGFAVFTVGSILLSTTWLQGSAGAMWMIAMRVVQGIGAAFLMANSSAILTDAFPPDQRGLALGINMVAAIAGSFMGLVLGGVLAPVAWRLVFLVSVPFGVFGTVWAYLKLEERGMRNPAKIDWIGNVTFGAGLILVLVGITYGILPYGHHTMGWTSPRVIAELGSGLALLLAFVLIERRVSSPMFHLELFRVRAFSAGSIAALVSALARGGLMFMLILWLQGIWLPEHGYSFADTPLYAGIYMLPLSLGFLLAGPFAGRLADHFGARPFTTGGMILAAISFLLLIALPVSFPYWGFALVIFLNGVAMGLFAAPNQTGIMNSLPPDQRGAGAGMAATFMNSAMVLSIGVFFSLVIVGLSGTLPGALSHGLLANGVPQADALRISHLPPVGSLFASFLGYNPMGTLLGPALHTLPHHTAVYLTGHRFFPALVSHPFASGIHEAFYFAAGCCVVAAMASWLRGGKYYHGELAEPQPVEERPVVSAVGRTEELVSARED
ncbi:MAG TPA: MFS transporter [Solirubrobacteraceae bacterium]|nr:MFS transporter [Solirubrobacteraceae bacterium]